jgi:hypothetical protein
MRARQPVGRPPFHPRQLFTGADLGFVQDPRVSGALFEESTGITPIASADRPNGLLLDDRFRLARGPELVTNGEFNSGIQGWNASAAATLSWVSEKLRVTKAIGIYPRASTVITSLTVGRRYEVRASFINPFAREAFISNASSAWSRSFATSGTLSFSFFATATAHGVDVGFWDASGLTNEYADFDSVSFREIPGSHATQASSPSRPLFQTGPSRVVFDGMDDSHTTPFSSSLGSACTVARAIPGTGAQILTGQTIGTTFTNTVTHAGMVVINRALTGSETANLTSWLNRAAGV